MSPNATKTESTFQLQYSVSADINASPERIWALLTNAGAFPSWNSTVTSIEGDIALGQKLKLKVPLAKDRVFTPKLTQFEPGQRMQWSDGMAPMFKGVRTFELEARPNGATGFTMREEFSGVMLPMIKGSLPDFTQAFSTYAADLKKAAEGAQS